MSERILKMPRLGETMEEGKIVGWLIKPGDSFSRGDPIIEIETDKTIAEFPALGDGRLKEVLVEIGDMIEVGKALARIDIGSGPDWTAEDGSDAELETEAATASEVPAGSTANTAKEPRVDGISRPADRVRATPLARRIAHRHGLDIGSISGTGRRGRIEKDDVLVAVAGKSVPSAMPVAADVSYASLRRGRMAYLDSGKAAGDAVLLLHGFSGDRTTWAVVLAGLKRAGKRVIAPDLPGHGLTAIEATSPSDLSADLVEFLDALDVAEVDIVAHSLGAVAALGLAGSEPRRVRSLSLIAPAGIGSEIDTGFVHGMAGARASGEVAHLLRRLSVNGIELSEAALEAIAADLARGRLTALADSVAGPSGQRVDSLMALQKLVASTPVRVLFGLEDRIIPWRHVLALPPRVAIHLLSRSGHMPQWDQPKDVLEILLSKGEVP
ncbi:acetoin dehydrogenase dihydrolipoyllysine-residue acetyltransferase subunit [Sinorhizobium meliloti]|jgi:pyruvate dehydrogenase E2 component (dihydrolipoamide acetyltransferase)|uniref:acetoin dehydrogenase dihydrolipoyllysine-residue acetyltransferase subunit n=1 Tax=Rhizobium meliloti TaxID=382 RepID=UPI00041F0DA5|nr:acetoin dehydrogenase dihydrolipoyllysine-residue acetyltransferase subunit [Sinorhizobium meliloti]